MRKQTQPQGAQFPLPVVSHALSIATKVEAPVKEILVDGDSYNVGVRAGHVWIEIQPDATLKSFLEEDRATAVNSLALAQKAFAPVQKMVEGSAAEIAYLTGNPDISDNDRTIKLKELEELGKANKERYDDLAMQVKALTRQIKHADEQVAKIKAKATYYEISTADLQGMEWYMPVSLVRRADGSAGLEATQVA